jgi:hypothetical protein
VYNFTQPYVISCKWKQLTRGGGPSTFRAFEALIDGGVVRDLSKSDAGACASSECSCTTVMSATM